jgi:flagellar biosynthesis protein FliP
MVAAVCSHYAAATNDIQRAAYVGAAHCASAVLTSRLEVVYAIVVLSSGILMIGLVMLKGTFARTTAYLALLTATLGIVSAPGFSVTIIMNAVFATIWLLFVGFRLNRLASE